MICVTDIYYILIHDMEKKKMIELFLDVRLNLEYNESIKNGIGN